MRVLIVEDDFTSRKLMHKFLSKYGDCDIATDGKEAVAAIRDGMVNGEPYDLICLDIMMPELDGHEVLKNLRDLESEKDIPVTTGAKVIMTSALGDSKNVLGAFRVGCEAYLEKPIDTRKLLAELVRLRLVSE